MLKGPKFVSRETLPRLPPNVSRETSAKLEIFAALLTQWNARVNLVGRKDLPFICQRHINDALQLTPFLSNGVRRVVDLGSGGGFPGLVLAIATGVHFDLIESDKRKAVFLVEAARITGAPVRVCAARIEDRPCEPSNVITSRALAPLSKLLGLAHPLLKQGGTCLFLKGRRVDPELHEAQSAWTMQVSRYKSVIDPEGEVLRISEVAPRVR